MANKQGNSYKVAAYFDFRADGWDDHHCDESPVQGAVVAIAGIREGSRVLDLGCGTGVMIDHYLDADCDEVIGVDVSKRMIEIADEKFADESRVHFVCADALDFDDDKPFDAVVIYNAYPHFLEKWSLVQKVASLLKPAGRFVIAHSTSKEVINERHCDVPVEIKTELTSALEASKEWEPFFDIDCLVDCPSFYCIAGQLRQCEEEVSCGFYLNVKKPMDSADGRRMLHRMNGGHHAELSKWSLAYLDVEDDYDVLDLGCGGGANLNRLLSMCPDGTVTGLDYSETSVEVSQDTNATAIAEGKCDVVLGDVADLPFEDESFDAITAFETIYFWPDINKALSEAYRVLRHGGEIMICNEADGDIDKAEKWTSIIPDMTVYDSSQISQLLADAGFSDIVIYRHHTQGWLAVIAVKE